MTNIKENKKSVVLFAIALCVLLISGYVFYNGQKESASNSYENDIFLVDQAADMKDIIDPTGLVGYWRMDEASWNGVSNEVIDSSGMGNHGIATGGANTVAEGFYSRAGNFDGFDDVVRINNSTSLNLTTRGSLAAWVYPRKSKHGQYASFFAKAINGGTGFSFVLDLSVTGDVLRGGIRGTSVRTVSYSNPFPVPNEWYHVAYVWNGSNMMLYINGVQVGSTTQVISGAQIGSTYPTKIGGDPYGLGNNNHFDGLIDDARIYNRALTNEEVEKLATRINPYMHFDQLLTQEGEHKSSGEPLLIYNFENKSGVVINDTSNNSNNGTGINFTNSNWTRGKVGNAIKLNGTNQYVESINTEVTNTFSSSLWIKPDNINTQMAIMGERSSSSRTWAIYTNINGGLSFTLQGVNTYNTPNNILVAGEWQHISFSVSGNILTMFRNGREVSRHTLGNTVLSDSTTLKIGAEGVNTTTNLFAGSIDNVRFYDSVLSYRDVAIDYDGGKPVGWWKFDEGSGTQAKDYSGNNNHGTLVNMTESSWQEEEECRLNGCLSFDGINDYLDIPFSTNLSNYSVSLWVKFDTVSNQNIFTRTSSAGPTTDWSHQLRVFNGKFRHYLYDGAMKSIDGTTNIVPNEWYHITIIAHTNGQMKLYVNGLPEGPVMNINILWAGGNRYRIGSNSGGGGAFFNGQIDEVRIFNYLLTDQDILREYNLNSSVRLGG